MLTGAVATLEMRSGWPLKNQGQAGWLGGFLSRDLGALAPGLRQADRDRLLAILDPLAAFAAGQRALFPLMHCPLDGFLGTLAIACHTHTPLPTRQLSGRQPADAGGVTGVCKVSEH
jgi:hypothetical protein